MQDSLKRMVIYVFGKIEGVEVEVSGRIVTVGWKPEIGNPSLLEERWFAHLNNQIGVPIERLAGESQHFHYVDKKKCFEADYCIKMTQGA